MDDLTKLIDEITERKLFSGEGFEAMGKLREKVEEQADKVETQERSIKALHEESAAGDAQFAELNVKHGNLMERYNDLKEREAGIIELEKATAIAQAQATIAIQMFNTAFGNVTVRRKVLSNVPAHMTDTGMTSYSTIQTDETIEETEE